MRRRRARIDPGGQAGRAWLAVILALTMVVAACSDDGDDNSATTTTEAGEADGITSSTADGAGGSPTGGTGGTLERYADHEIREYADPQRWLCRPDVDDDFCDTDLSATVIEADGSTEIEVYAPASPTDQPIDCFYVYPTISRDETAFSDWNASAEEEGFVVVQQAARLGQVCRLFAPVYRQRTLAGLFAAQDGEVAEEEGDPYADVLDAFRTYMAQDNEGRGFVVIGHSQGSSMLTRLLREEVDGNDDVRELFVGGYLAGSSVTVPEGEVVGGDFENIPLCTAAGETGCVVTWASFRDESPPVEGSLFGRPYSGEGQAGCVNPAAVEGGSSELGGYWPADAKASILSSLGVGGATGDWLPGVEMTTPFVKLPGLVSGECIDQGGFNYLSVTVHADPDDPRADDIGGELTPQWGLHLVDVTMVMGDVVDRVSDQVESYAG